METFKLLIASDKENEILEAKDQMKVEIKTRDQNI